MKMRLLKLRVRAFKKIICSGSRRRDSFFFLGPSNGSWLTPYMHHSFRGEGSPKKTRKVLQRNRPPNDYKASGLLLSHLPIKQTPRSLKTPAGPAYPVCRTYPGKDWQMDFTEMPISQGY